MDRIEIRQRLDRAIQGHNDALNLATTTQVPELQPYVIAALADQRAIERELALFAEGKLLEAAQARVAHAERRFDEASAAVQVAGRELHRAELVARGLA